MFVEPFAGGASVGLQLLNDGLVERIALGDKDELVSAFWKTVFFDADWLIKRVEEVEPNLQLWEYYRAKIPTSRRERAFACLFLNRTSFSGILSGTAGPIGGRAQQSAYAIGCRFPKQRLINRIRQAEALAAKVTFVRSGSWQTTIRAARSIGISPADMLYYFDPPFFTKADRLYRHFFIGKHHKQLAKAIATLQADYVLSYDVADPIIKLYADLGMTPTQVQLLYSTSSREKLMSTNELIVTNLINLPTHSRLWFSKEDKAMSLAKVSTASLHSHSQEPTHTLH
ncbi:DNA adenine methylase [Spirosoma knui]